MIDNAGSLYIVNDRLIEQRELSGADITDSVVYEVIRIIDLAPLFFEDHYMRLKNSLAILGKELEFTKQQMAYSIQKLVKANSLVSCNVKIVIFYEGDVQNCLAYISKSYYPSNEEVSRGVGVALFNWERKNPNVKLLSAEYKRAVSEKFAEGNYFELLLVNSAGKITEGSKSNVFFVKGTKVFTAPGECILKGVTREYIINVCIKLGLDLVETLIDVDLLDKMEGVFISGTSIKVLPVSGIDGIKYSSGTHPTVVLIRDQFDRLINEHVEKSRQKWTPAL
ncbi:branched-chain amino acid aminotransferase [Anaerobacterium chartisolvens]|uniref:Branched-chain amino acid aminotransferase n=1 Tax=Anaerobacterium chartisolvens TaxID=1297424 RepID=A0A369B6K5_9FIRM|nr:aminotransferase class IV [Anaerobacterium chartisolvens]RCX17143.1 branched-chain amino acid aminotransferase [Anaerobacterium chartisolvens]